MESSEPVRGPEAQGTARAGRWLTQSEASALIRAAEMVPKSGHLADFIRLGLYTGMRPGEVLGLEWSRVDLSRNLIYLGADNQRTVRWEACR
jgi:integrase